MNNYHLIRQGFYSFRMYWLLERVQRQAYQSVPLTQLASCALEQDTKT
jgi:aryl carrier-like protein